MKSMKPHSKEPPTFIGVDPGANGALAILHGGVVYPRPVKKLAKRVNCHSHWRKDSLYLALWAELSKWLGPTTYVVVERQVPCQSFKRGFPSRSYATTILYGNYMRLMGMLDTSGVNVEELRPLQWQQEMRLPAKAKRPDGEWKNLLKDEAQRLFPKVKVTLAVADALLLAYYCREKQAWLSKAKPFSRSYDANGEAC